VARAREAEQSLFGSFSSEKELLACFTKVVDASFRWDDGVLRVVWDIA
jgi:hypothetical protein